MEEFFCAPCIAAMPAAKFWFGFVAIALCSAAALYFARRSFIRARLIEDMPTSRVRSASQGYVELSGLAKVQGNPLTAPLTAQPCLWWRYTIERHEQSGKSSSWNTVDKGTSTEPFFMTDGTGICRVDPNGAEIHCLHKRVWRGSTRLPETAVLTYQPGVLERLSSPIFSTGKFSSGKFSSGDYRYTEYVIKDGDPLYLLGHFVSDATGSRVLTVDQIAGRIIRSWKQDYQKLLVTFDKDGNGVLDEKEWHRVRAAATVAAKKQQQANGSAEVEHLLRKPEDSDLPYLIGSHGQEVLSKRFRWQAMGGAGGFLLFGAFATWVFGSRFIG